MDSNDIERERGITILSKNTAVNYNGTKINIIDTPGHADFGGEVERVLKMVNGVILVVDAYEGVMPQTKFVLRKALELGLSVVACINKIDRPEARPDEVEEEVLELLMDLDATEEQLDCPFLYASAKGGFAKKNLDDPEENMSALFQTIIDHIPAPEGDPEAPTQLLISTIDYNEYVGRIGVGKVDNGSIRVNQECVIVNHHDPEKMRKVKVGKLYEYEGLNKVEVTKAEVLYQYDERNRKLEPMEIAYIDVPEEFTGAVIQKLTSRKGELQGMSPANGGYTRLEFSIPSRGLIGYRGEFMTDTKGNGIMNTAFDGYAPYKGDLSYRKTGSLIAYESGESITYGLFNAQERGILFIGAGVKVYSGMVIGQNPKAEDIEINVCKTKKLTNPRSSSADEALQLTTPKEMSLEQCLDFIDTDELLEITPVSLRIRKKILDPTMRKRSSLNKKSLG